MTIPASPEENQDYIDRGIIPPGATLARASGTPSEVSLSDEYQPSPEREEAFVGRLGDIAIREKETEADISEVGLQ